MTELSSEWIPVLLQTAGVSWTAGPGTHKHLSHRLRATKTPNYHADHNIPQMLAQAREEEEDKNGSPGHSSNMTTQA